MKEQYQTVIELCYGTKLADNIPTLEELSNKTVKASQQLFKLREELEELQLGFYNGKYAKLWHVFNKQFYPLFLKQQTKDQMLGDVQVCAEILKYNLGSEYCFSSDVERCIDHLDWVTRQTTNPSSAC